MKVTYRELSVKSAACFGFTEPIAARFLADRPTHGFIGLVRSVPSECRFQPQQAAVVIEKAAKNPLPAQHPAAVRLT